MCVWVCGHLQRVCVFFLISLNRELVRVGSLVLLLEKTALNQTNLHEEGGEGMAWSHLYYMINV